MKNGNLLLNEVLGDVVKPILDLKMRKTLVFLSPKKRIKATRRSSSRTSDEIILTVGVPNWKEKKFLKNALKKDKNFFKALVVFPYK